jgi:hypothetical protein
MSELATLSQLLISSAQPPVHLEQLVKFVAFASRLKDDILLAQPAAFNVAENRCPVLPPSIQGFLSDACSIPLPSINIIWKVVFPTAWNTNSDITPAFGASESESPLTDYEKFGYSRGISKTPYSPLSSPLKLCIKCVVNSFSYNIPSISLVHEQELRKIPTADAQEK